jgi:hypothetical protein
VPDNLGMQFTDETEADLRGLIEQDFGRLKGDGLTHLQVLDWIHYRARLIPCRARSVAVSPEVAARMADYPAIARLKAEFEGGRDVSPWLSDTVRKRKDDPMADLMFNDWQISHFHLGNLFVAPDKVGPRRKGELLLFALVKANRVTFLALHPHGAWSMQEILRVLLRTSPQDLHEMKGAIPPPNSERTDAQILELRQNGLTAPIQINGKMFLPLGVSTSLHSTRLVLHFDNLSRQIRDLGRRLKENDLPNSVLMQLAVIGVPVRLGIKLHHDGCLVLHEKTRGLDLVSLPPLE